MREWFEAGPCHIGVIVGDLREAMATYSSALGLEWAEPRRHTTAFRFPSVNDEVVTLDVVWSLGGPIHYELIEDRHGTIWSMDNPGVLHHVGYWIDKLVDAVGVLNGAGFAVEATLPGESPASGFAYLRHPEGLRVELMDVRSKPMYDEYLAVASRL
jgi:hypothetical protein